MFECDTSCVCVSEPASSEELNPDVVKATIVCPGVVPVCPGVVPSGSSTSNRPPAAASAACLLAVLGGSVSGVTCGRHQTAPGHGEREKGIPVVVDKQFVHVTLGVCSRRGSGPKARPV
ncbi:hypothetical protein EYF80_000985 [Liparis tanakae]|uniref:Uncharacterized protein n=1 Tax=Liparis tanakae TaxID=230148 RepID=A0A4Z2JFQ3_9TELE|nr:hypothetical protein EYF80_000985 [Liparis tanakae]